MGKIILIIALFLLIGCNKTSDFIRGNTDSNAGLYVKSNTFINSPGIYYYRDIDIVVKQFKEGTIVYGLFSINNNKLLYQRNINNSISNNMKWTIYVDNRNQIWFYNADYQEINVFVLKDRSGGEFIEDKRELPSLPIELINFIKK